MVAGGRSIYERLCEPLWAGIWLQGSGDQVWPRSMESCSPQTLEGGWLCLVHISIVLFIWLFYSQLSLNPSHRLLLPLGCCDNLGYCSHDFPPHLLNQKLYIHAPWHGPLTCAPLETKWPAPPHWHWISFVTCLGRWNLSGTISMPVPSWH